MSDIQNNVYNIFTGKLIQNETDFVVQTDDLIRVTKPHLLKLVVDNTRGYIHPDYAYLTETKPVDWYAKVKESIEARFGDNLPKHFRESMASEQSYPYMYGCIHNLSYPYGKKGRRLFNKPMPVPCKVKVEIAILTCISKNNGDPLAWIDLKYRCSYNHIINRRGKSLLIQTRSDLIAHDDYIAVLDKQNHFIQIFVSGLNDKLTRQYEPGAPSNERRIEAYQKLKRLGFDVRLIDYSTLKEVNQIA